MRVNSIRGLWERDQRVLNCWLLAPTSLQAEMISRQGFDSVVVDLQHGALDYRDAVVILTALQASAVTPVVRVSSHETGLIMKVLDAGASGVICPVVDTREQAEAFVRACRYPPQGERSFGPLRAAMAAGASPTEYFASANDDVLTIVQVESATALGNLDEILSTPGLDAVYVGSADLAISLGEAPAIDHGHPEAAARHRAIVEHAHAHGVKACLHALSDADVEVCLAHGADLVTIASDLGALTAATGDALASARALLATTDTTAAKL
jgi:4-hydroxy-2-oxoheptanedioate aldolase